MLFYRAVKNPTSQLNLSHGTNKYKKRKDRYAAAVTKLVEGNDCAMHLSADNDDGQLDSTDPSTPNSASVTDNELSAARLRTSLPTAAQLSTCYKCQPFKPSSYHFF